MKAIRDWAYNIAFGWVVRRMAIATYTPERVVRDQFARIEVDLTYAANEEDVIEKALMRRFDPAPIWNAAINRAIERKKAAREDYPMPNQQAFDLQQRTTRNALRNA